ncbi:UDP-N-acetylmuramoyl-L-alanine--D-glutamate ligase [Stappia sp. ES.058]|uniref:UDP-N-acetylmuramoyl-L-alanine--D-glutamate ligase n=1 Tax=Stappia sp. ES.058 TaxID=1881061 RepID=UPI000879FB55|nr:UDP-N-acetylmuramoyl-L-alanine--D-glutamate ligase [Stappia sp. ES.058]SDU27009.1 UDP-N-acetylmuramoylalanine--D-glutamate ligase [Stappia sp. ES.058]
MIAATSFADQDVALFGLGASGLSAAHALLAGGARVHAFDDMPERRQTAASSGIPVVNLKSANWSKFAALVLAPGVPLTHPTAHWSVNFARQQRIPVIGDVELFCRERHRLAPDAPFVAITGTNGKSTTTALISHCLAHAGHDVAMGGNIGVPILDLMPPARGRVHVIECSSYQIDLTPSLDPSIGVLLNITPDHLDRHGSLEHYAAVKERLIAGSRLAVVGVDDGLSAVVADRSEQAGKETRRLCVRHPVTHGVYAQGSMLHVADAGAQREFFDLAPVMSLRGAHNAQNAAAAVAVCQALGLSDKAIHAGLACFPGLAHRMQVVARDGQVLFVNDSKATNADAAERALTSFEKIYWIAGGRAKAGGIAPLAPHFHRIAKAYLIGDAAGAFAETLDGHVPVEMSGALDAAVAAAARDARAETGEAVVLLSPACASFDQFPDFQVRGRAFTDAVRRIVAQASEQETV